jgi:hypothetical protein
MLYKDNWLAWSYDSVKFGNKTSPNSNFEFQFKKHISRPLKSHKEELLANARLIRDSFFGPFDLLFSGGIDSEIVLRCYHELRIPINIFIFKYKNDYNHRDVFHALRICNELNITPTIIDFDLKRFFENDAYDIWKKGYFHKAGMLPHMKMIEYLDNMPILGEGEPDWIFEHNSWKFKLDEADHSHSIYGIAIDRPMIACWHEYSPEVILSHMQLSNMQRLIDNAIPGNQAAFDIHKYYLYKKIWPEIIIRQKMNGFEGDSLLPKASATDLTCIREFKDTYITPLNMVQHKILLSKTELVNLIG